MTSAMEERDSKALIKASRDQGEANLLIEMYEKQLDKIMHGPLISAGEYDKMAGQLEGIAETANRECRLEIVEYALRIQTEAGKLREVLGTTDHLLRVPQGEVYRHADVGAGGRGGFIPALKEKCVKDWTLVNWASAVIDNSALFNNEILPASETEGN